MTTRWPVLPILLPLLLGGDLVRGEAFLQRGMPRLAEARFRAHPDPDAPAARAGVGRALARQGRCAEAVALLQGVRGTSAWTAPVLRAEAGCLWRLGRTAEADAAWRELAVFGVDGPREHYLGAVIAFDPGDPDRAARLVDALEDAHPTADIAPVLRAGFALEAGDPSFDARLQVARHAVDAPSAMVLVHLYDGIAFLDADDPVAALDALDQGARLDHRHQRIAAWRAEALRRQGFAADAHALLALPVFAHVDAPVVRAVRARALVDLGHVEDARAELAPLHDDHPEVLASRWYLARAVGDPSAPALARRVREGVYAVGRDPSQLVPLPAREAR